MIRQYYQGIPTGNKLVKKITDGEFVEMSEQTGILIQAKDLDTTLWNRAFGGLSSTPRCTHCFSVSHKSSEARYTSSSHSSDLSRLSPSLFLLEWGADCKFEHSCYLYLKDK